MFAFQFPSSSRALSRETFQREFFPCATQLDTWYNDGSLFMQTGSSFCMKTLFRICTWTNNNSRASRRGDETFRECRKLSALIAGRWWCNAKLRLWVRVGIRHHHWKYLHAPTQKLAFQSSQTSALWFTVGSSPPQFFIQKVLIFYIARRSAAFSLGIKCNKCSFVARASFGIGRVVWERNISAAEHLIIARSASANPTRSD